MAPKRRAAPTTPAGPAAPTCRGDGVPQEISVFQTMRKDGKTPLKHPKATTTFRPHSMAPKTQGRNLEQLEGKRYERRPSKVAKKAGKRRITEVDWADEYVAPAPWAEANEPMPDEDDRDDCGWLAGPVKRPKIPFLGPTPGPTNKELSWEGSSWGDVMNELITPKFRQGQVHRVHVPTRRGVAR